MNYENEEDFKRGLLILFYPFQNEMIDIHEKDITKLYSDNEDFINEKKGTVWEA